MEQQAVMQETAEERELQGPVKEEKEERKIPQLPPIQYLPPFPPNPTILMRIRKKNNRKREVVQGVRMHKRSWFLFEIVVSMLRSLSLVTKEPFRP